jgi:HAE1 family hydrophobic/amphiphilic exporter-1
LIRLTQLAVSKRSVTVLITLGLLLGGLFSWSQLNQELLPNIQLPFIVVITPMPGASAQDVSIGVTQPIERSIGSVPRLSHIDSSSVNSLSIVVASFSYGTDVKETKAAIDANVKALSLGVTADVESFDINALPPITAAIRATGGTTTAQLNALAATTIVPSLEGIDGVSKVDLSGTSQDRLVVKLDPALLAANNVSISQIQGVLAANNLILPAGSLPTTTAAGTTITIPVSAQHELLLKTKDDILALAVGVKTPTAGSAATTPTLITLGDLGSVAVVPVYASGYAELNSDPSGQDAGSSLILSVSKTSDANTVNVVEAVKAKLDQLKSQNGGSFEIVVVQDYSSFIIESRDSLVREGGLGALFAIITIFVFLLSLRSTLVAAVSIPVSIMTALVLMLVAGVTINIMTLGGLAIAVGRVVDDAIVVLENIYRHRGRGDPMREAVISGTREVASAITSSTLTTVAVFLPLGFVGGIVSQFFLPFALTVTFALLASLVCALTVVPVLASIFIDRIKLDPDEGAQHHETIVQRIYTPLLRAALHNRRSRWGVVGIAMLLVFGAGLLIPHIPTQFLNTGSQKYLQISVAPPSGTPSSAVLKEAQTVEAKLRTYSEINLIETTVPGDSDTGLSALSAAFTGGSSNTATIVVRLDNSVNLDDEQKKLADDLATVQVDSWQIQVAQQSQFGGGSGISVVVSGTNPTDVASASTAVIAALKNLPDLINVKSDLATKTPEFEIDVDPNKAILDGTTTVGVQGEVHNALVGTKAGTVNLAGLPADVYLQLDTKLDSLQALQQMPVGVAKMPLGSIATVSQQDTQARISRVDQSPASTISADTISKDTGGVSMEIQKVIDKLQAAGKLPGVTVTLSGVTEEMNTAFGGLFVSMAVAILLVYIVMVLVFNSLIDPLVIMFSLPLATIGAFPALFITQRAIGISALIGFLMLIGIVVTNAIVLLDLVEQHRRRGLPMYDALMQGGRTRVRPILMTAIATILALMPLALGLSEGEIIASELATVVIGGLFTSTFLTLIVVPVVYSLVEDAKVTSRRRLGMAQEHPVEQAEA